MQNLHEFMQMTEDRSACRQSLRQWSRWTGLAYFSAGRIHGAEFEIQFFGLSSTSFRASAPRYCHAHELFGISGGQLAELAEFQAVGESGWSRIARNFGLRERDQCSIQHSPWLHM